MNKKGFTLIEVIAIVILLGIIALVTFPIFNNMIKNTQISNEKSIAKSIVADATALYNEYLMDGKQGNIVDRNIYSLIEVKDKPSSGSVIIDEYGNVSVAVVINERCYKKSFNDTEVELANDCNISLSEIYIDPILNGAIPELDDGMIPIVIENGIIKKADIRDEWYNYSLKKWANAVLVSGASRNTYKTANPGTTIQPGDIKAYYVWVPRYKYQIFANVADVAAVEVLSNINNYENKAQLINVVFENKTTTKSTGSAKNEWLTHPAFTFGTEELNGIWVGKFETTGTAANPTVLPYDSRYTETSATVSLRNQNVSTQFLTSQKLNYGLKNKEASMLKNMEWGALAYLSASTYGQGTTEIVTNNVTSYYTGCAATITIVNGAAHAEHSTTCQNEWYTTQGQKASTTGNVYGVYDTSGGSMEYVMGIMEGALGSGLPASGVNDETHSGFTGVLTYPGTGATSITGVAYPNSKYYDLYTYSEDPVSYQNGYLGDATSELGKFIYYNYAPEDTNLMASSWNMDSAFYNISFTSPWYARSYGWTRENDGIFAFASLDGAGYDMISFRSVLR